MNVKLAHKWDTPATLGCTVESVKFETTRLYFEAKWYVEADWGSLLLFLVLRPRRSLF